MRLSNIFQLGIKELRGLARDRVLLVLIVYSFTLAIYAASTGTPQSLNRAPIAVVDDDRSPLSLRISGAFYPPYFSPPSLITPVEMDRRMDEGIDTFALDIPSNFQRDLLAGRSPTIQLNVDATRMSQAFVGSGYIGSIVSAEVSEFLQRYRAPVTAPVDLQLRARFNSQLNSAWFGAVMEVIGNITMLAIVLTGAALIREREHGTTEHLLAMPVTRLEIMISKIWAMGLVVLLASALSITVVVQGLLAIPIQGSMALFLLGTAFQLFATASLGIFLATVAGSMPQFGMLMILILLPLEVLSGAMSPRENMPELVQNIMMLAPNTHFVSLAQAILFRGAGLDVVWPQFLAMATIGGVLFAFSLARFRASLK